MSASVALMFGAHAHQPAGNFTQVLKDAHACCYRLFLETCNRYPGFRSALHFSGPLLDYLFRQHPADVALLARMVGRGQVELFVACAAGARRACLCRLGGSQKARRQL